jgi:hypothetical protein
MKRLVVVLAAALALGLPGAAAAMVIDPGPGGGGGPACDWGTMTHEGFYSGTVPYYGTNSIVQLETTITNLNVLGFLGAADVYTYYPYSSVSQSFWLYPSASVTIVGPTYTTGWNATGVPYTIDLSAVSDAVWLSYKVCV